MTRGDDSRPIIPYTLLFTSQTTELKKPEDILAAVKSPEDIVSTDHIFIGEVQDDRRLTKDQQVSDVSKGGLRKLTQQCADNKKVTMYKFCINGDCDAGAQGEHRLKLDGNWLYGGYRDYREGQCHSITVPSQVVEPYKSLTVGTEEHDTWSENDSWFAEMSGGEWYNPKCATYEVRLAKQFEAEKAKSVCWDISAEAAANGVTVGAGVTSCTAWTQPAESFMWILKVEPEWVTTGTKRDNPLGWHDIDGSTYDCNWYSQGESLSVIFSWFQYEYHMLLKCALLTQVLLCHDGAYSNRFTLRKLW
jgi:hypothetical protein